MLGTWCSHGKYYTSSCYSYSDPGSMRALYASAMLCSLLLGFLPPTGVSTWIELWHCDMTNSNSDMIDEMWTLFHTSLFLSRFPLPTTIDRSRRGRRSRRDRGRAGEANPALLGHVVVRLFRVVRGDASSGGLRGDGGPGSDLLGSLPHRQRAGLRSSWARPWAWGVKAQI